MPVFRRKPVEIEAMQFIGPDPSQVDYLLAFDDWVAANQGKRKCRYKGDRMTISTRDGEHEASPGDWIICEGKGVLYPCAPDSFAASYDLIR